MNTHQFFEAPDPGFADPFLRCAAKIGSGLPRAEKFRRQPGRACDWHLGLIRRCQWPRGKNRRHGSRSTRTRGPVCHSKAESPWDCRRTRPTQSNRSNHQKSNAAVVHPQPACMAALEACNNLPETTFTARAVCKIPGVNGEFIVQMKTFVGYACEGKFLIRLPLSTPAF